MTITEGSLVEQEQKHPTVAPEGRRKSRFIKFSFSISIYKKKFQNFPHKIIVPGTNKLRSHFFIYLGLLNNSSVVFGLGSISHGPKIGSRCFPDTIDAYFSIKVFPFAKSLSIFNAAAACVFQRSLLDLRTFYRGRGRGRGGCGVELEAEVELTNYQSGGRAAVEIEAKH